MVLFPCLDTSSFQTTCLLTEIMILHIRIKIITSIRKQGGYFYLTFDTGVLLLFLSWAPILCIMFWRPPTPKYCYIFLLSLCRTLILLETGTSCMQEMAVGLLLLWQTNLEQIEPRKRGICIDFVLILLYTNFPRYLWLSLFCLLRCSCCPLTPSIKTLGPSTLLIQQNQAPSENPVQKEISSARVF